MPKSADFLINMLRNVTGRVDASDPMFTDTIMLGYLNDFLSLDSTQDIRIFQNRTWWEFNIDENSLDPYPVDLQNIVLASGNTGASTIEPPAYVNGFEVFWYQSPTEFYRIWPETQVYLPQRPTYILYYNNALVFRGPPDQEYPVKIAAYEVQVEIDQNLNSDYLYRYCVYGAALNLFADYAEWDQYNQAMPVFRRYRSLVYARTYQQYNNQRTAPDF